MIRAGLAAATMLLVSATAIAGPLDGRWAFSHDDCARAPGTSDSVPLTIADNRMDFYESVCEIAAIEAIGTEGTTWRLSRVCRGEGETWTIRSIFAIDRDAAGAPSQLIEINIDNGHVTIRQHCN